MESNKIEALVGLLNDDDPQSYDLIKHRILEIGSTAMPFLKNALEVSIDKLYSEKLNSLYHELNINKTISDLQDWQQNNYTNLFQGLALLSQYQYPRLQISSISSIVNKIRQDLWLELKDSNTALEKVKIFNHIFFKMHGFKGNSTDYYAPENSFINDVLLSKKGSPITLSVIYSIVAQSVGVPIYGVNTPRNFMLVYLDQMYSLPIDEIQEKNVLFYINPFVEGEVHSLTDIFSYLKRIKHDVKTEYYLPCSNATIIRRSLNNIIVAYEKKGNVETAANYKKILTSINL